MPVTLKGSKVKMLAMNIPLRTIFPTTESIRINKYSNRSWITSFAFVVSCDLWQHVTRQSEIYIIWPVGWALAIFFPSVFIYCINSLCAKTFSN